jgi:hypothetical protein
MVAGFTAINVCPNYCGISMKVLPKCEYFFGLIGFIGCLKEKLGSKNL